MGVIRASWRAKGCDFSIYTFLFLYVEERGEVFRPLGAHILRQGKKECSKRMGANRRGSQNCHLLIDILVNHEKDGICLLCKRNSPVLCVWLLRLSGDYLFPRGAVWGKFYTQHINLLNVFFKNRINNSCHNDILVKIFEITQFIDWNTNFIHI